MTISRIGSTGSRIGRHVALAGAAVLLVAACGAAAGEAPSPSTGPASTAGAGSTPTAAAATIGAGAPVGVPGNAGTGVMVTGGPASWMAIAYPYPGYPGTPGLAPDHTIVVTGFGQAPLAPDQSNRAATQQVALKAALADAKSQAEFVASATGVTIKGVLSVSVSSSQGFIGPVPMMGGAAPNSTSPAPGGPTVVGPPIAPTPELEVTVTVEYRIG